MAKTHYITTPIYYASGNAHIGNSYSTIFCDVFSRYYRLKGDDVYFLTGMDEHGQKIENAASASNKTPKEFVDEVGRSTSELWKKLKITNDDFICTSEERHIKVVQKMFEQLLKQDDIYLSHYEGEYCVPCEAFFTKTQIQTEGICPDCGRPLTKLKEESYFLRLTKYQNRLLNFIKDNPYFIQPESRKNEVISFIEQGLEDLCVSRTAFKWGIPVLSNPRHVIYVWVDALSNYITALGYKSDDDSLYQKYWVNGNEVIHVVGKDILRFHAIYWPIILMALDVPVNYKLHAHGWIVMKDGKMSKSRGNIVYPQDVTDFYGLDSLRYYLIKEMPIGNDGLFTWDRFIERYNVDLANDFGNLVSRTISMINKYFGGKVEKPKKHYFPFDEDIEMMIASVIHKSCECYEKLQFQNALSEIWSLISRANKYIDETSPWVLAKDEEKKDALMSVMYHLYEILRIVAILASPVMTEASVTVLDECGVENINRKYATLKYGITSTANVVEKALILFKRLDINEELKKYEV